MNVTGFVGFLEKNIKVLKRIYENGKTCKKLKIIQKQMCKRIQWWSVN